MKVAKLLIEIFYLVMIITKLTTTLSGGIATIATTNNVNYNSVAATNDNVVFCFQKHPVTNNNKHPVTNNDVIFCYDSVIFCFQKHPANSIPRLREEFTIFYGVLTNVSTLNQSLKEVDNIVDL